jgi:hypothetical protein
LRQSSHRADRLSNFCTCCAWSAVSKSCSNACFVPASIGDYTSACGMPPSTRTLQSLDPSALSPEPTVDPWTLASAAQTLRLWILDRSHLAVEIPRTIRQILAHVQVLTHFISALHHHPGKGILLRVPSHRQGSPAFGKYVCVCACACVCTCSELDHNPATACAQLCACVCVRTHVRVCSPHGQSSPAFRKAGLSMRGGGGITSLRRKSSARERQQHTHALGKARGGAEGVRGREKAVGGEIFRGTKRQKPPVCRCFESRIEPEVRIF